MKSKQWNKLCTKHELIYGEAEENYWNSFGRYQLKGQHTAFDIDNYYPPITRGLLIVALSHAKKYHAISDLDKEIILHSQKSVLFKDGTTWIKNGNRSNLMSIWDCGTEQSVVSSWHASFTQKIHLKWVISYQLVCMETVGWELPTVHLKRSRIAKWIRPDILFPEGHALRPIFNKNWTTFVRPAPGKCLSGIAYQNYSNHWWNSNGWRQD